MSNIFDEKLSLFEQDADFLALLRQETYGTEPVQPTFKDTTDLALPTCNDTLFSANDTLLNNDFDFDSFLFPDSEAPGYVEAVEHPPPEPAAVDTAVDTNAAATCSEEPGLLDQSTSVEISSAPKQKRRKARHTKKDADRESRDGHVDPATVKILEQRRQTQEAAKTPKVPPGSEADVAGTIASPAIEEPHGGQPVLLKDWTPPFDDFHAFDGSWLDPYIASDEQWAAPCPDLTTSSIPGSTADVAIVVESLPSPHVASRHNTPEQTQIVEATTSSTASTYQTPPNVHDDDADEAYTKPASSDGEPSAKSPRPKPSPVWSALEQNQAIKHMRDVINENEIKGEARFNEVARRLVEDGFWRNTGGVKNQWNRTLRERSGIDERKNKSSALATSQQTNAAKAENARKRAELTARGKKPRGGRAPAATRLNSDSVDYFGPQEYESYSGYAPYSPFNDTPAYVTPPETTKTNKRKASVLEINDEDVSPTPKTRKTSSKRPSTITSSFSFHSSLDPNAYSQTAAALAAALVAPPAPILSPPVQSHPVTGVQYKIVKGRPTML